MIDIRQRLLAAFELEHKEHLAELRQALRAAAAGGGPGPDLDEMHRRAHSLKGAARAVDLPAVEAVAHRLESVFLAVQAGRAALGGPVSDIMFRALDAIEDIAAAAARGETPEAPPELLDTLEDLGGNAVLPVGPRHAAAEPAPPGGAAAPARSDTVWRASSRRPRLVRINSGTLGHFVETAAALLPEVERQGEVAADLARLRADMRALDRQWHRLRRSLEPRRGRDAPAPAVAALPGYLDAFQQRLRAVGDLAERAAQAQRRGHWSLKLWGGTLQDDVRRLRMVPADTQFGDLGRMVRELARGQGKELEVDVRGLDTEADREVLQQLKDPVVHLVRNAVGHGIEMPGDRLDAGKRAAGRIAVTVSTVAGRLRMTVEDDGRGLDLAAIARTAVERGLLSEEEAEEASPERLLAIVLEPGFSTAGAVTELSGRGMGLSIVREAVRRLQGNLTIAPRDGGGTVVTVSAPILLSTQRLLFVAVAGQVLALPGTAVSRMHRVEASAVVAVAGTPMLHLDGEDLPVTSLSARLGLGSGPPVEVLAVAVVRTGSGRVALAVDGLVGVRDALVSSIDEVALDPARFIGTVLLDDGSPALVLNPDGLGGGADAMDAFLTPERPPERPPPTILVVDDSITTRTLERSILEAHGYTVLLSVDGRDALERLGETPVDLIVSDVEMPHMDGYTLLQVVKGDPRTADIPVILVTSRDSDEDRERGLRLGADAYIVKTRFDQGELLEGIRRLL
ncbi:response regulator [Azospirillum halopraeferens]|uniref:response regulator n=1 Tax=Azospirillum halopraeferens TaxID=34010 RepID=UPI000424251A|nr:response regulator [Azospirillum halopraeferens]